MYSQIVDLKVVESVLGLRKCYQCAVCCVVKHSRLRDLLHSSASSEDCPAKTRYDQRERFSWKSSYRGFMIIPRPIITSSQNVQLTMSHLKEKSHFPPDDLIFTDDGFLESKKGPSSVFIPKEAETP